MRYFIFYYILAINLVTLIVYGIDKYKAKNKLWRVSESVLIALAVAGGSLGALGAMYAFRHKTKHPKFTFGIPLIMLAQIAITILLVRR